MSHLDCSCRRMSWHAKVTAALVVAFLTWVFPIPSEYIPVKSGFPAVSFCDRNLWFDFDWMCVGVKEHRDFARRQHGTRDACATDGSTLPCLEPACRPAVVGGLKHFVL